MKYSRILIILFFIHLLGQEGALSQQWQRTERGLSAHLSSGELELRLFSPEIVRILKYPAGQPAIPPTSLAVTMLPEKTAWEIQASGDTAVFVNSRSLRIRLDLRTGCLTWYRPDGALLLTEEARDSVFIPVNDAGTPTYRVSQAFQLAEDETIYGLGQHQAGAMNQRGQKILLKQNNMQVAVPLFHSVKGYALFWDNTSTTVFEDNKAGASFTSEVGSCADYYFIAGGNADRVIAGYRRLTGQSPMFPRWAFGFWQSRERYKSQYESVGVVRRYRALQVPLDGIIQDWQYWSTDDRYWNSTEFGNPLFPDPKAMVDSVHQLHAHMIISVWPSFGDSTAIFRELQSKDMLLHFTTWPVTPDVQPYDAFNPEARDIYWRYINRHLFSLGLDGWWLDSTEPDQMSPKEGDDDNKTHLGSFRKVRNAFPLVTTGGVYAHQRATDSGKRVFILARSAFAGQQRNATMIWSGDVQSRWDVLRNQIAGGLNLSLSGIPYWNSDIGGFFPDRKYPLGVSDPAYRELYVRWFEFAAFCPMFRSHGTYTPREIYQFGDRGTWAFDAQLKFINLRYRLLPYNYSNAWRVTSHAGTLMRALVMDFPTDTTARSIGTEYLFGPSFLVCPVTDSLYVSRKKDTTIADFSQVRTWPVYLPQGARWYNFWTGERKEGGQWLQQEAPIDGMPLYVREGSIVPLGPAVQYSGEKTDPIEIRIYPGADASFDLYEDENDNYDYEKGQYALTRFTWNDRAGVLTIGDREGHYPGMPIKHIFNIVIVKGHSGAGPDAAVPFTSVGYTGKKIIVKYTP